MDLNSGKKQTIMLLGGAGFLGYYTTKRLVAMGHKVIIYDKYVNFLDHDKSHYKIYLRERIKELSQIATMVYGDIRDTELLTQTIQKHAPDTVVLYAAIPIATVCNRIAPEALDINLMGAASVIKAIGSTDIVKRIVFASSSFVYGHFKYAPADEKHPTSPIDVYCGTKLAGESIIIGFCVRYGIEYTIVRPSAVYGALDANRRVSQIFVENALLGKTLKVHDPVAKLDFSYVEDTANGFALAATQSGGANQIFNITCGQGRTLVEFANILKNLIPNVEIEVTTTTGEEKRPLRDALDVRKAKELLGYEPQFPLERGLAKYVPFVRNILL